VNGVTPLTTTQAAHTKAATRVAIVVPEQNVRTRIEKESANGDTRDFFERGPPRRSVTREFLHVTIYRS